METVQIIKEQRVKDQMQDILVDISWRGIAHRYFGKSASWLYHKMDGIDGNGKPNGFNDAEKEQLRGALCDLSERIRRAADKL